MRWWDRGCTLRCWRRMLKCICGMLVSGGVWDDGWMREGLDILDVFWRVRRGEVHIWLLGTSFFFIIYVLASVDTPSPPPFFLTTADFFFLFLFFFRSSSGIVNIYDSTSYSLSSSEISKTPKPIKSIGNLTTAISSLKFNHDAQLLAMTSREKKDSMRLVRFFSLFSKCWKRFFWNLFSL